MSWLSRIFFLLVAALAAVGVVGGAACTRRGHPSIVPPTASPLTTLDVNPITGSDTTGNGTPGKPYRTLTKAVSVAAKSQTLSLTIELAAGTYDAATGEVFPIVVPVSVTIAGTGYGAGPSKDRGTFINGAGEDTQYEKAAGIPSSHRAFATLVVPPGVGPVSLSGLYVGSSHLAVPGGAEYASADALGAITASHVTFAAATSLARPGVRGVLVPGGSMSCTACTILGSDYALLARTLPSGNPPRVTLSGQPSQSIIGAAIGIGTDSSADVDAAYQTFQSRRYAYRDDVAPMVSPLPPGAVDFGHGQLTQSAGGNVFIGARTMISEISVTAANELVSAYGNTWNPLTQGTNAQGQYAKRRVFRPGDTGENVTIARGAVDSLVEVGPIPPTPQPSPTPSGVTPTPSPTG